MTTTLAREYTGSYLVMVDGAHVGGVFRVWYASHIRRGRMQTRPRWRARRWPGVMVIHDGRDAWQTRREAVDALLRHLEHLGQLKERIQLARAAS